MIPRTGLGCLKSIVVLAYTRDILSEGFVERMFVRFPGMRGG